MDYLNGWFEHRPGLLRAYPFTVPVCATCKHWVLLTERGRRDLLFEEADIVNAGVAGEIWEVYYEDGRPVETVKTERFYGWCKRYPPKLPSPYYVGKYRFPVRFELASVSPKISDKGFPLIQHNDGCGEWAKAEWVEEYLDEHRERDPHLVARLLGESDEELGDERKSPGD